MEAAEDTTPVAVTITETAQTTNVMKTKDVGMVAPAGITILVMKAVDMKSPQAKCK